MTDKPTLEEVALVLDSMTVEITKALEAAEAGSLPEALKIFWRLKTGYQALDDQRKAVYKLLDTLDKQILPKKFDEADTDLIRLPDLARSFYPNTKYGARTLDKEALMDWLRETGMDALISETVNASTLAGYLKERLLNDGLDPPEDIVELTSYQTIGSSKYTPK